MPRSGRSPLFAGYVIQCQSSDGRGARRRLRRWRTPSLAVYVSLASGPPRRRGERLKLDDGFYREIVSISCSFYLCSGDAGPLGALGFSRLPRTRGRALLRFTGIAAAAHCALASAA